MAFHRSLAYDRTLALLTGQARIGHRVLINATPLQSVVFFRYELRTCRLFLLHAIMRGASDHYVRRFGRAIALNDGLHAEVTYRLTFSANACGQDFTLRWEGDLTRRI